MNVHEPLTAHDAFHGHMAVANADLLEHGVLARCDAGQRDVSALALQRHPAAVSVGQQARDAQSGSRADQSDRALKPRTFANPPVEAPGPAQRAAPSPAQVKSLTASRRSKPICAFNSAREKVQ